MIVRADFLDHWKTNALIKATQNPAAPLILLRLWAHCQHRKTGRFKQLSDIALASICRWEGDPGWLKTLLVDCGFLEQHNDGFIVHDWEPTNAQLINSWKNGSKGGRPKKPIGSTGLTQAKPKPNPREPSPLSNLSNLSSVLKEGVRGRFDEWMKYRRGLGGNVKDWTTLFRKQIEWLPQFSEQDQLLILDQSMRNGWRGLFEPKANNGQVKTRPKEPAPVGEAYHPYDHYGP